MSNLILLMLEKHSKKPEKKYTGRVFIENCVTSTPLFNTRKNHNSDTTTILPLF
jgi:hypothetical protein